VVWQITPGKKPRVDRGVEGFDTTIQHLWKPGDVLYRRDGNAMVFQQSGGTARGEQADSAARKCLRKFQNSSLIRHADECSANCNSVWAW
jgi:hypothetical protein